MGTWDDFARADAREQAEQFIAAMTAVVTEAGANYVYTERPTWEYGHPTTGCRYTWNGQADCLIGRTFAHLGLPLSTLEEWDAHGQEIEGTIRGAEAVCGDLGLKLVTTRLADAAQVQQDGGDPWGRALERARDILKVHGDQLVALNP